jgi:hypothetical protein
MPSLGLCGDIKVYKRQYIYTSIVYIYSYMYIYDYMNKVYTESRIDI